MHYRGVLSLTAAALSTSALAFSPLDPPTFPPPTLPPTLTPLFTLDTVAGDLQAPIPLLLSGYQGSKAASLHLKCFRLISSSVYPLLEGTISGPALNGTIHHGTSYPHVTDDGMFAFSHRHYCGKTDDGKDFVIQQQGVGYYLREQTWLVRSSILILLSLELC